MVNQVKSPSSEMPPAMPKAAPVYPHSRTARLFLLVAALSGFLWVSLGAIAGHEVFSGLHASFFDKAHRYQIVHTLALMLLATLPLRLPLSFCRAAGLCWLLGLCCFCGSLYVMAFLGTEEVRYLVPVGGVAFLVGWAMLFIAACVGERS